jgi:hypothetical protein
MIAEKIQLYLEIVLNKRAPMLPNRVARGA